MWLRLKWVKSFSHVWLFATLWSVAHQAPPSMGFSRQEYWTGLPFPSPGDLPNPGIEPRSPALQGDALTSELPGKKFLSFPPPWEIPDPYLLKSPRPLCPPRVPWISYQPAWGLTLSVKAMVFPIVMYRCESWAKNWCFGAVTLEKTLENPLDYKEIKPINPKGN